MDRTLDEVMMDQDIPSRGPRRGGGGSNRSRGNDNRRGGYRKNDEGDTRCMDSDWLHDKYDDEDGYGSRPTNRFSRDRQPRERSRDPDLFESGSTKLRVENVHYDLSEDDLRDLFTRIAPVLELKMSYDRAGRSIGTAYVTYRQEQAARKAIQEFDGANANGQPIRLSIIPSGPAPKRNPFDSVVRPSRSLADRIERPRSRNRDRSRSPGPDRRDNARRNQRDDIDRYVPRDRSRSPRRGGRGRPGPRGGRGDRRGRGGRMGSDGRPVVQGRPRYTQEELDKDMDNYWGTQNETTTGTDAVAASAPPPAQASDDIDMVE